MPQKDKRYKLIAVLKFLWSYIRKYKGQFYFIFGLSIILSVFAVFTPYVFGKIIDSFLSKELILGLTINQILVVWIIVVILEIIIKRIRTRQVVNLEVKVEKDLVLKLTDHILNLPVKYHYDQKSGEVFKRIDRAANVSFIIESFIFAFADNLITFIFALIVMLSLNVYLAGINLFFIILFFLFAAIYKMKEILKVRKRVNTKYNVIFGYIGDFVGNIFTVKINTAEKYEINRLKNLYLKTVKVVDDQMKLWTKVSLGQGLISNAGIVSTIVMGSYFLTQGILSPGNFVTFIIFLEMIYRPLWWMSDQYRQLKRIMVDIAEAQKLLNISLEKKIYKEQDFEINGQIEFQNVSFNYPGRDEGILQKVTFKVPAGHTLAIFGETGSGKTTIYNLLLRMYDHNQGQILFDGFDVQKIDRNNLRKQMAVVPQDPSLFNESIEDNIRYGRQEATMTEIIKVAKIANAHDFIMALPKGYKTKVGERGVKLSGGQVQRIAIARAALRDPRILILDEATTSLDQKTKFEVLDALQNLIKGRTTIIITHDFSAITQNADHIIVLNKGRVVEQGKHAQLVKQVGPYRDLWYTQQKHLQIA